MIKILLLKKTFEPGAVLFREGDAGDEAFMVRDGFVAITKAEGNRTVELATRGPGSIIGEMALIDQRPRSATVTAKTALVAEVITRKDLDQMIGQMPDTLQRILLQLLERLRDANELAAMYAPESDG